MEKEALCQLNFDLDAQPQALQQAQPAAVEQARHQQVHARELSQDLLHLGPGQPRGQAFGLLRADGVEIQGIKFLAQHFAVEEQQRAERLSLRRSGDMLLGRQVYEESADFRHPHFTGVAFVMEENEAPNPLNVSFFGAEGIMFEAQRLPDQVQQFRGVRYRNFLCKKTGVSHNRIVY